MADPGSGARPRLVCNSTPVALITGVRPNTVSAARPIATVRISSSDGGVAPSAALARTSLKVARSIRFNRGRPTVAVARRPGSDRSKVSTDGTFARTSPAMVASLQR